MCEWPDFDAISIHYKVPCAKESQKGDQGVVLDRFIDASFGSLTAIVVELLSCWLSQTRVSAAGRHLRHNSQWPIHWEVINIGSPSSSTLTRSGKDVETAMFDLAAEQAASFEGTTNRLKSFSNGAAGGGEKAAVRSPNVRISVICKYGGEAKTRTKHGPCARIWVWICARRGFILRIYEAASRIPL
ncbi:hypothetical protein H0G86_006906 [Trichoderma simmonsii]|uniref:Uncharacterized protein n=1 Tax=Trichoderma simmonsii TaxID=1491479 RepID=A0A8G0LHM0_9HYPO|nr:hypothetical protein H0G86_006906 [Trichoderma simmonsii]